MVEFGDMYLDATDICSPLQYGAHHCSHNNTLQELWTVVGELLLVLTAARDIPQGAELSWNYVCNDCHEGSKSIDPKALWFHCTCKLHFCIHKDCVPAHLAEPSSLSIPRRRPRRQGIELDIPAGKLPLPMAVQSVSVLSLIHI